MHVKYHKELVENQQVIFEQLEELVEIQEVPPKVTLQAKPKKEVRRPKPMVAKYMRRHHALDQIIRDKKKYGVMKRKILSNTCLLCEFEPKS